MFFAFGSTLGCAAWVPLHSPQLVRSSPSRAFISSETTTTIPKRSFGIKPVQTTSRTQLNAKKGTASSAKSKSEEVVVALLHSHHLLDHKPDNLILKGGKHKLRGVACLGRPGVALCVGPTKSIAKFQKTLESAMPQKRFKTKVLESVSPPQLDALAGFEEVSLGEFRIVLASVGEEAEFFALTGIAPEIAAKGPTAEPVASNAGGGAKAKNKKRKRK